ncbi:MAG: hypothetical protein QM526_00555 [Alphaproteobacteria bacterium]|nr:hypothetical protein [Alphaproteobacteria bacterium]
MKESIYQRNNRIEEGARVSTDIGATVETLKNHPDSKVQKLAERVVHTLALLALIAGIGGNPKDSFGAEKQLDQAKYSQEDTSDAYSIEKMRKDQESLKKAFSLKTGNNGERFFLFNDKAMSYFQNTITSKGFTHDGKVTMVNGVPVAEAVSEKEYDAKYGPTKEVKVGNDTYLVATWKGKNTKGGDIEKDIGIKKDRLSFTMDDMPEVEALIKKMQQEKGISGDNDIMNDMEKQDKKEHMNELIKKLNTAGKTFDQIVNLEKEIEKLTK